MSTFINSKDENKNSFYIRNIHVLIRFFLCVNALNSMFLH